MQTLLQCLNTELEEVMTTHYEQKCAIDTERLVGFKNDLVAVCSVLCDDIITNLQTFLHKQNLTQTPQPKSTECDDIKLLPKPKVAKKKRKKSPKSKEVVKTASDDSHHESEPVEPFTQS